MLKLKQNKSIKLDIPEFTCDSSPLGNHLNKYDMLKHLNGYFFTGFIGKPGSGKTSLLVSMLTGKKDKKIFRKAFDNVIVVMPSTSRNSMKNNIFKNHKEDKLYEDLDISTIETIYNQLLTYSEDKENTLLILDDVGASLKNVEIQKRLRQIIYNRRHLKCHIVILLQSFMSIPKEVRKLFNNIFMWKPSKVEFQILFDELFETKKDLALHIMNFVFKNPHDYLMLNVDSQKLYTDFNEIIINENEN
jgi:DNA replication protein DnaC